MPSPLISLASPHERMPALRLLFSAQADPERERRAERCRDALASADSNPTGLFVARDSAGRVRGAAMVEAMPGALGLAWLPRTDIPEVEDSLVKAACDWLRASGVKVCQTFASPDEASYVAALERHGFRHITQLAFLRRYTPPEPPPEPRFPLEVSPEMPPFGVEFLRVLLATHEGTLDCPEQIGGRTADELLAGLTCPTRGSSWWHLARHAGEDVGVVILTAEPEPGTVDLAYIGILPSHRGQGMGDALLTWVLREFHRAGIPVMTLSVDVRNEPALRLYRRHGFIEIDRREVWLLHIS